MAEFVHPQSAEYHPGSLSEALQRELLADIRHIIDAAPLFTPAMPKTGKAFSVRMTNCGPLGWVSDKTSGYRYQETHPDTGEPWPAMPELLLDVWDRFARTAAPPEACLINVYAPGTKMGLHQDRDEEDFAAPVLSISLGQTALFRLGGTTRKDPTHSFDLKSGDIFILGGPARLAYHGVDRIKPGTSDLLTGLFPDMARINLTLRRVSKS